MPCSKTAWRFEMMMKILGYTAAVIGFVVMAGTAGSADYYEECRAAVDCVADAPMSMLRMFLQLTAGLFLMVGGAVMVVVNTK